MRAWRWMQGVVAGLLLSGAAVDAAPAAGHPGLARLMAAYDQLQVAVDPLRALQRGDDRALPLWPDERPAAMAAQGRRLQALQTALRRLPATLRGEDALNRDLLLDRIALDLDGLRFDEQRLPYIAGDGFYTQPNYAADLAVLKTEAQQRAWLQRIATLPTFYAQQMDNLRRGLASGWVRPRLIAAKTAAALRERARQRPEAHVLLRPLQDAPAALRTEALDLVRRVAQPAEQRLADFFEQEVLPRGSETLGIGALPDGPAYYAYLIRRHASTQMSAEAVHRQGLAEVARLEGEMTALMRQLGFQGRLAEFLQQLREDRRFYARDMDDYLQRTRDIAKRADAQLPRFFQTLPRLSYGVRVVDEAMKDSSAGYIPGSPKLGVAGMVVVNFEAVRDSPLYLLPAWVAHEGVPGHHLQIALAQEREDLPAFRRDDSINAYVEGWALYTEALAAEMGLYRDDHERFGRLSMDMWRACRLVIDTGLHTQGWTREQAVAYLRDRSALGAAFIEAEIDRYIGWPGQALGYKLGELRIRALRQRAEQQLGARFDLRAFHDQLLRPGAMPLDLLERELTRWIAAQQRMRPAPNSAPAG